MQRLRVLEKTAYEWNLSLEMPWVLRAITQIRKTEQKKAGGIPTCYLTDKRHTAQGANNRGAKGLICE